MCLKLLNRGDNVIGIDNHNDYYDPKLKDLRLERLIKYSNYQHYKEDLTNQEKLEKIFQNHRIYKVVNLAAQAGVRYSIEKPLEYINSNIVGFANILENCRHYKVEHLVYASTSSVYGANTKMPFSEHDSANQPLSVYAASKKSNELMAHSYSHLYQLPTTGLRFFTVYGPWGRPDMALYLFVKKILKNKPIDMFNNGNHARDFTYIDDIVTGIVKTLIKIPKKDSLWGLNYSEPSTSEAPFKILNIGNGKKISLKKYVDIISKILDKKVRIRYLPMQDGDIKETSSDIKETKKYLRYNPRTNVKQGIKKFIDWYKQYHSL